MNPVIHFELPCDDRERLATFFERAFGWKPERLGPEMGNYVLLHTEDSPDEQGPRIKGGIFTRDASMPGVGPNIVIGVSKLEESMRLVTEAGGKVQGEPMEIPGVGLYVTFLDTEGNRSGMLQPLPMATD